MKKTSPDRSVQGGLTEEQKRSNVIRLAFKGDEESFAPFLRAIDDVVPFGTTVVLRGSALTGFRWKDHAPFDVTVRARAIST
jgi:hypothetical protein